MSESVYRAALAHIKEHPGTGAALGLAKLILSMANTIYPYGLADCVGSFDGARKELAKDMIVSYLTVGRSDEMIAVAREVEKLHPELRDEVRFMHDAITERRQAQFMAKVGGAGMRPTQLDKLDEYAQRLIDNPDDGSFGVLSSGERMYVLLAASRADLLAKYGDTIPEALARLGEADTAALLERWQRRHYQPFTPGAKEGR